MRWIYIILPIITGTLILLSSCSTTYNTMGDTDSMYLTLDGTQITSPQYDSDNFSQRNVNPEYIARYQSGGLEAETEPSESTSVNVYNNFYGYNGMVGFNPNFHFGFGYGFGFPMWGWHNPWWGWNMGFGWGMGGMWGNPWMMNPWMGGMMWGNPWMMDPWMGGGMWGWGGSTIIVIPPSIHTPHVVRGPRPGRGSGIPVNTTTSPTRSVRRDATASVRNITPTPTRSSRNFTSSQNEYTRSTDRVSPQYNNRTGTRSRNVETSAPRSGSRYTTPAPTYNTRTYNNQRSERSSGTVNRNSTPYNRGNTGRTYTTPSRNTYSSPSRGGMSTPSRGGSMGAPSRSSGGGFSGGGMSGGSRGGGGMSTGGSRGGRGNN